VKGGDPFIFGRGGEELQVLREAGIPVVVVPGITAGIGAAASAGIPLTMRGLSQAVTFVTATGANSASLDWKAMVQAQHTLVFYMSAAQIDHIASQLAAHGMAATQPVALLERATWPEERVLKSTLGELPALARGAQLQSPSLLIVGEVAALAHVKGLAAQSGNSEQGASGW
jgi:siroheme synthase